MLYAEGWTKRVICNAYLLFDISFYWSSIACLISIGKIDFLKTYSTHKVSAISDSIAKVSSNFPCLYTRFLLYQFDFRNSFKHNLVLDSKERISKLALHQNFYYFS